MAAPQPSTIKQHHRVLRSLVRLLIAAGFLLAGAVATFEIATNGWQIERALHLQSCWSNGDFRYGQRPASVGIGGIAQLATLMHNGINVVPPNLTEDESLRIFDPDWQDNYDDPLLKLPEADVGPFGVKGRRLAQGDVMHHRVIQAIRSGWPMYALHGVFSGIDTNSVPPMATARTERRGIAEGSEMSPTIPIPLGFAVNTLFFASVFATVVFLPFLSFHWIRRAVRAARVQCVDCGYQLRSRVAACPECGRGMPHQSR